MTEPITGAAVVALLRAWIEDGVPYQAQGRDPAFGMDCIGGPWAALEALGAQIDEPTNYGQRPNARAFHDGLKRHGDPIQWRDAAVGDFVLLGHGENCHLAVLSVIGDPPEMIHCNDAGLHEGKVFIARIGPRHAGNAGARVRGVYRPRAY